MLFSVPCKKKASLLNEGLEKTILFYRAGSFLTKCGQQHGTTNVTG